MKKIILVGIGLALYGASGFCGDRHMAFERDHPGRPVRLQP